VPPRPSSPDSADGSRSGRPALVTQQACQPPDSPARWMSSSAIRRPARGSGMRASSVPASLRPPRCQASGRDDPEGHRPLEQLLEPGPGGRDLDRTQPRYDSLKWSHCDGLRWPHPSPPRRCSVPPAVGSKRGSVVDGLNDQTGAPSTALSYNEMACVLEPGERARSSREPCVRALGWPWSASSVAALRG